MKKIILFSLILLLALLISCQSQQTRVDGNQTYNSSDPEEFLIVDCLLPGQLRKLGQSARYLTARRPIKTSASDCEIRGGEYVAYDRANYATALRIWLPKAKEGDADAQAYVGEIYEKGLGLEPDYAIAINWYLKAAQQGNTRAQLNLGYMHETGLGVRADKTQAMNWYRKASGLAEKQIAYTYTAETAAPVQDTGVRILKAELSTSQNEAKRLNKQLQKTRQQVLLNQQKLLLSQSELKKSRLEQKNNANSGGSEVIKSKEISIAEQENRNKQLDKKYENQVQALELKLSETEKRAHQLADDLSRNKSEKNSSQLQLLNIQAQLAKTEKQLLSFKNTKPQETVQDSQLNQAQKLKLQIELEKHQLKSVQKQLIAFKQEKNQQLQTIQELMTKNNRYKQKIQQLNDKLSSSNVTQTEINQLKNELARKKQASEQSQRQLNTSQQQYQLNEDQYRTQEELYNVKLKNLDSEKKRFETLYAASFKQSQSSQTKIAQLIKEKNQQWDEQQKKINTLTKEKQQLNEKLLTTQNQARKESSSEVPVIEIIDPVFVQLRGVPTVTLRSVVKQRQITGKVTSTAGISSLTINDRESPVDQLGLFKQSVALLQTETPVQISAVDNRGKKAILDFIISMGDVKKRAKFAPEASREVQNLKQLQSLDFGQYHAIIIANNKYNTLPFLSTPINDGKVIERILRQKYGFKTRVLENATRYQILSLLNEYRSKLTKNDNLLVYYAGHGELDRVNMRGHWLPIDADADNTANWISTVALTDIFNSLAAKHLMVVADSCYSGAMTRSSLARLDTGKSFKEKEQWLKAMLRARSRTILSSGGLKPVLDGGGGDHSVFAKAFIDSLENNEYLLEGQALHRSISTKIVARAADYGVEQVPEYAPIRHAGHEAGEFFFVPTI